MITKESPNNWTPYQLSDIYTERREPGNDTLPMLTVSIHDGVSDGELDDDELGKKVRRIADKTQYRVAKPGDLVFNMMRAWQGAIGVARSEGMVSPAYIVAKPNDRVYPLFMDYYMKTPRMVGIINRQSYGVTDFRKRLYWDSFAPINVMLPPIAEQKKIAAILTTQDKVIELKEKRLAEKQRQKKYLMQQLLTGKKRLDGFSAEWEKYSFKDIFSVISSREHQIQTSEYLEHGSYPVIDQSKNEIAGFSNEAYKVLTPPQGGIIIFGDHTREVKYIDYPFIVGADGTQLIIANNDIVITEFMYYWLSIQELPDDGYSRHFKYVKQFVYLLPSKEEQSSILTILSSAQRETNLLQQDLDQEKQKKKALMQLLLTGKVRVQ